MSLYIRCYPDSFATDLLEDQVLGIKEVTLLRGTHREEIHVSVTRDGHIEACACSILKQKQ
eukprot:24553-Amphidinium_carterae.1